MSFHLASRLLRYLTGQIPFRRTLIDFLKTTEIPLVGQEQIQTISMLDLVPEDPQDSDLPQLPKEMEMLSMVLVMVIQEIESPIMDVADHSLLLIILQIQILVIVQTVMQMVSVRQEITEDL